MLRDVDGMLLLPGCGYTIFALSDSHKRMIAL